MPSEKQSGQSSEEPAERRRDTPSPEQGSPPPESEQQEHGPAEKRVEKGEDKDPNPLAPPVNTQAGS